MSTKSLAAQVKQPNPRIVRAPRPYIHHIPTRFVGLTTAPVKKTKGAFGRK